ncbi:hypothetical protein N0V87_006165 [Didymella glomerata]|uniref:DUF7896 domain-containing protein n=1 Tax=Didymella glomerata TaxID=749621 RepID=A0A9W8WYH1_9PLEO|nr:hypothetical protein N0V87_006165 [Didymella glomerata]
MDRTRSAPASRPRSTTIPETNDLQRSASDFGVWAATSNEPTGDYALYSGSMQPQVSLQAIPETTVEYTPSDYVNTCIEATSPSVPFDNMHVQLTPQWQSSDYSTSPSTPQTALMTPVTQSSNAMSRQSSLNTSFFDETSLRVPSEFQYMPILNEDSALSLTASSCFVGSHSDPNFLSLTGPTASETVMFPAFTSVPASNASVHALVPSDQQQNESYLAEDMRRSTSQQSSESNASSTRSIYSRQSRREREINAMAASRPLAPKASDETEANAPSNAQMARVVSSDGSSKTVGVISKTPYVRPQHPKIMCQHCNERPDGFRGTHELDRHIARAHAPKRKGYICVAPDFDKSFLLNCKHCRSKKVYGAYYNAAAHLRRAHFHPRKRGRKGKNDEKRGGIGGGDHPAMDWLREHWIRDVEVDNNGPTPDSSPDSAGEGESDAAATQEPTYDMIDVSAPYPVGQQPLPQHPPQVLQQTQMQQPPNMIPLDYGLSDSIQPVDPVAYETFSYTQVNDFQFDAYGLGP